MSFPKYAEYKDSGVEWLGKVPRSWRILPIKRVVSTPVTDGPHETPQFIDDGVPFVSAEAISSGQILFERIRGFISQADHERYCEKYKPQRGDIFMVKSGASTGTTAMVEVDQEFSIWSPLAAIRCGVDAIPKFVLHFLRSRHFQEGVTLNWSFGTQQNIGMNVIENLKITLPALSEQRTIVAFLDQEAAKIDALVAEQRRLIELLQEKRQAVISHAVTKGLNPDVRMKPSGIEWLGDVPEHWEVVPLRRLIQSERRITYGIVQPGKPDENGRYMVRGQDYSYGWVDPTAIFRVSDEIEQPYKRSRLAGGDLIMTIVGAGVGNVTTVPNWLDGANITQTTARIAVDNKKANAWFVQSVLKSAIGQRSVSYFAKGAAQPGLNLQHVKLFPITKPPLDEQTVIEESIRSHLHGSDFLITECGKAITLLQERRTALISAAVTGKIDVRGWANDEERDA